MPYYRGPNAPAAILVLPDRAPRPKRFEALSPIAYAEIRKAEDEAFTRLPNE